MTTAEVTLPCPYVGLDPFQEADREFFFGRDRERQVVAVNPVGDGPPQIPRQFLHRTEPLQYRQCKRLILTIRLYQPVDVDFTAFFADRDQE